MRCVYVECLFSDSQACLRYLKLAAEVSDPFWNAWHERWVGDDKKMSVAALEMKLGSAESWVGVVGTNYTIWLISGNITVFTVAAG